MNTFVKSSLTRLVQAASPRKHKELIRECKAVLEELEKLQTESIEQPVQEDAAASTEPPQPQQLPDGGMPKEISGDVVCMPLLLAIETNSV